MARIIQTADLDQAAIEKLTRNEREWIYNGLDCCVTLEVLHEIKPQLDDVSRPTYEFSKALQGPFMDMQTRGLLVDQPKRQRVLSKYLDDISRLERNLDRIIVEGVGALLNWRSPKQLGQLLYDVMGIPEVKKRNAQGRYVRTVNRDALEKLTSYYFGEPICNHILALRDIDKKRQFLETGIDEDGRMRCNFNISGTKTGRPASSMSDYSTGTNLQNVSHELREVFVADKGMKFANLDLEQADSRNLGALCWNAFVESKGEEFAGKYLDACESEDLHVTVCRMAWPHLAWTGDYDKDFKIASEIVYRDMSYRYQAKRLGHGTNFDGRPPTMSKATKIPQSSVKDFQLRYFKAFPCIKEYHKLVRYLVKEFGFLTTPLGRRRYFFGRPNDDKTIRDAIAYSPQSMTADEIDQGIISMWREHKVQMLVQVHDSILIQYPEEMEDEIIPWAVDKLTLEIPLLRDRTLIVPVEAQVGWNWGDYIDEKEAKKKEREPNLSGLRTYTRTEDRTRPPMAEPRRLSVRDL